ncbi:HesB/YadR/YfhF family protein [Paenibacillus sp. JX-17]|uniref:HesB/YadR/YfhF family protein n=1 Tax=Paenibacillus lacisoli TaxID=3064525 RepID=A0ABT9C901_9BACL|nr:HesB/YadR/YfhF family protein [Paenibacillus sp. JX-17]MDO7905733.1 HesB/YadR/YfhF family protein [Paenibacillus sp. JX-17]
MSIHVTEPAAAWYKKELGLHDGDYVRFFARYSSGGGLHPGFSLGIAVEQPQKPVLTEESGGLIFYMEEQDHWYLKGHTLEVKYLEEHDDIVYNYSEEDTEQSS